MIKDQIGSALGEKCWIDLDGIESNAIFETKIIGAINNCQIFLFMYSNIHTKIEDFENDEIGVLRLLVKAGLASSNGEARRNVEQGGVAINGEKVSDVKMMVSKDTIGAEGAVIKRGKKKFVKVLIE